MVLDPYTVKQCLHRKHFEKRIVLSVLNQKVYGLYNVLNMLYKPYVQTKCTSKSFNLCNVLYKPKNRCMGPLSGSYLFKCEEVEAPLNLRKNKKKNTNNIRMRSTAK